MPVVNTLRRSFCHRLAATLFRFLRVPMHQHDSSHSRVLSTRKRNAGTPQRARGAQGCRISLFRREKEAGVRAFALHGIHRRPMLQSHHIDGTLTGPYTLGWSVEGWRREHLSAFASFAACAIIGFPQFIFPSLPTLTPQKIQRSCVWGVNRRLLEPHRLPVVVLRFVRPRIALLARGGRAQFALVVAANRGGVQPCP